MQSTVDQLRQIYTDVGLRVYRVYMVWTRWTGQERGEGTEREVARIQILPNPKVDDLTKVALTTAAAGLLPVGSLQISQVTAQLTADNLRGLTIPGQAYFDGCQSMYLGMPRPVATEALTRVERALGMHGDRDRIPATFSFFYEVVEDCPNSRRMKFRLYAEPYRDPEKFEWRFILERISEDNTRSGVTRYGPDPEE